MDTLKDAIALNDLWSEGAAPWRLWGDQDGSGGEVWRAPGAGAPGAGDERAVGDRGASRPPLVAP